MDRKLAAHLALFIVNLIYGGNYLIAKGLMPEVIGPSGFIFLRVTGAGLMFFLFGLGRMQKPERKDIPRFALCAALGVAANQLFFFNGLNITSPINASILMTSSPILVLLFSWIILGEKLTPRKLAGIVAGATGAIILIMHRGQSPLDVSSPLGDAMVFINATCYALYLVVVKPLMHRYSPITVISIVFSFGWLFVLPFGWEQATEVNWDGLQATHWGSIAYVVVGTTFIAYLFNIFAIKYVSPSVVSAYIYLQPLLAAVFAWLAAVFLDAFDYTAAAGWTELVCALLIFAGIYLVSGPFRSARKRV